MGRPSMGRHGRTVPVTVKVTQVEAAALRRYGSPSKGLRALIDRHLGVSDLTRIPVTREGGACRIHRTWSDPVETVAGGIRTTSKVCQDCGHVSTTTRPS